LARTVAAAGESRCIVDRAGPTAVVADETIEAFACTVRCAVALTAAGHVTRARAFDARRHTVAGAARAFLTAAGHHDVGPHARAPARTVNAAVADAAAAAHSETRGAVGLVLCDDIRADLTI
jgi:hypothetical protein